MLRTDSAGQAPDTPETARGRVRRLLIDPLKDGGFRFKQGTEPAAQAKYLNRLADELTYMSDAGLRALYGWAHVNGAGSARCFWPAMDSMLGTAQLFEPRPLEEVRGVASWFGSVAGPIARDANRLAAEFWFWQVKRRPPRDDREKARILSKQQMWDHRVKLTRERLERGVAVDHDDMEFLRWFEDIEARALALVEAGEDRRAEREKA